jgi:hypothetical protein
MALLAALRGALQQQLRHQVQLTHLDMQARQTPDSGPHFWPGRGRWPGPSTRLGSAPPSSVFPMLASVSVLSLGCALPVECGRLDMSHI